MIRLTPVQKEFLMCAISNGGDIIRPARSSGWNVAGKNFRELTGEVLYQRGMIKPVKKTEGGNTERLGMGYHYRITDAGHAAVAKST